jgi:hypothetical protein
MSETPPAGPPAPRGIHLLLPPRFADLLAHVLAELVERGSYAVGRDEDRTALRGLLAAIRQQQCRRGEPGGP